MAARRTRANQKGKIILFVVEIIIIIFMVVVLYLVMNSKAGEGPKLSNLDPKKVEIHEEIEQQTEEGGTMHGYMNIALFGLDAETDSQLFSNSRSDCTMIASINLDTGDIKLVSVYRDTYLNIGTDKYQKCNAA